MLGGLLVPGGSSRRMSLEESLEGFEQIRGLEWRLFPNIHYDI